MYECPGGACEAACRYLAPADLTGEIPSATATSLLSALQPFELFAVAPIYPAFSRFYKPRRSSAMPAWFSLLEAPVYLPLSPFLSGPQ